MIPEIMTVIPRIPRHFAFPFTIYKVTKAVNVLTNPDPDLDGIIIKNVFSSVMAART